MSLTLRQGAQLLAHSIPSRVLAHFDSRLVVMEVETRQGVCNSSPAEWTRPENGWCSSGWRMLSHCCLSATTLSRRVWSGQQFSCAASAWLQIRVGVNTTFSNGSLSVNNDEGHSEV